MENTVFNLEVPFPSKRYAEIVYEVLRVDAEPSRSTVKKKLKLEDNKIILNLHSPNVKNLRVAINALFDNLHLVMQTLETFGPPSSDTYDHYNDK